MEKILTIGIPTYNRSLILNKMLNILVEDLKDIANHVEIIISDNCSTDDTEKVIKDWFNLNSSRLEIKKIRNKTNIGVSRNIVSLLYEAKGKYFMFLGDDDRLNRDRIKEIISILSTNNPASIIQTCWPYRKEKKHGVLSFAEATDYFYEFGNAWAGILRTKDAINSLETRKLRENIEKIVWPQTVAGFLSIYDSQDLAYGVNFEIGFPLEPSLNITNKSYWTRSLHDLLKALQLVEYYSESNLSKSFLSVSSPGFISHLRAIFLNSMNREDNMSTYNLRAFMCKHWPQRGRIWSIPLLASDNSKIVFGLIAPFFLLKGQWLGTVLKQERLRRMGEISNKEKSSKRFGDWF